MNNCKGLASFLILGLSLGLIFGCASSETLKPAEKVALATPIQKTNEPPVSEPTPQASPVQKVDPAATEKAKPLFEAIVRNDDKKAKMAYGRAVRVLPEIVQLAVDLRFRNYEHAASVLPKTNLSNSQQEFWTGIIKKRPLKLEVAVCEALIEKPGFPSITEKIPPEEASWLKYFDDVAGKIVNPEGAPKEGSELTKALERVICTERECGPIQDTLRDEMLTDKFFDNLHNMRRRDTRFYRANYKNPFKLWQYRPYVSDMVIFKFYQALKNTPYTQQAHFIRRFKGIARDMRSETILSRSIAAIILGDEQDQALAKRLGTFITSNSLISAITRLEGDLPSCHAPMNPTKPPAAAADQSPAPTATPSN